MTRTLAEMREEMRSLAGPSDPEIAHGRADDILCEAIQFLAAIPDVDPSLWVADAEDLVESYKAVRRWYA